MEFPDLTDYFRHLAAELQSPIDFRVIPMPDRILVVDDEEPIREIVASMLGTAGYACKQAASGMEALAVLTSGEEFELMLSDLMMADLDGIGLLERTKEKYPDMPVVMVTAVHDISVALAAIRNGAYDYLLKAVRARATAQHRQPRAGEPPPESGEPNLPDESGIAGQGPHRSTAGGDGKPGAFLRHHAGGPGRRAGLERSRDRRPLEARHCFYHRDCPRHGPASRTDQYDRARSVPARHREDGHSRQDSEQAGEA